MKKKNKTSDEEILQKEFDFSRAVKGPAIENEGVKLPVSIRLDSDIIAFFKDRASAIGKGSKYQTLINDALREYINGARIESLLLSTEFLERLGTSIHDAQVKTKKTK